MNTQSQTKGHQESIEIVCHAPVGRLTAQALIKGAYEAGDTATWTQTEKMSDPGVEAMNCLVERAGDSNLLATCSPVIVQAPILRNEPALHHRVTPVARLFTSYYVLAVPAVSQIRSVSDIADSLRKGGSKTAGFFIGSIAHILAHQLARHTGADFENILRPDQKTVLAMLARAEIDWLFAPPVDLLSLEDAGLVRILGITAPDRIASLPQIPALAEGGIDLHFQTWTGIMAPPGLSDAHIDRHVSRLGKIVRTPLWQEYLRSGGHADGFMAGSHFAHFMDEEKSRYSSVLKQMRLPEASQDS